MIVQNALKFVFECFFNGFERILCETLFVDDVKPGLDTLNKGALVNNTFDGKLLK